MSQQGIHEVDIQGLVPFMTSINFEAPLLMVGVAVEYPANPCIAVVASEAGLEVETDRNQMTEMIFPTVEDQFIIYFNKSGLADMTIDMVDRFIPR